MTPTAEQRRLGREKRRDVLSGVRETSDETAPKGIWPSEIPTLRDFVRARAMHMRTSPRAATTFGAVLGVVGDDGHRRTARASSA